MESLGRLGPYDLLEQLGRGGMGVVYRAVHRDLGRSCALKILPQARVGERGMLGRWRREAQVQARLVHPNLPRIFDLGRADGLDFLAMELVDGSTLDGFMAERGALDVAEVLWVGRELLRALAYVHAHGVIHRDLKPSNVMTSPSGVIKLMDFGLVLSLVDTRLTDTGQILGTPTYLPPEVLAGEGPSDRRADLFQWAALACECLLGEPVWSRTPRPIGIRTGRPLHPLPWWGDLEAKGPAPLLRILRRCLSERAADRYPDVAAVQADFLPLCAACPCGPGRLAAPDAAGPVSARSVRAPRRAPDGTARPALRWTAALLGVVAAFVVGCHLVAPVPVPAPKVSPRAPVRSASRELDLVIATLLAGPQLPTPEEARRVTDLTALASVGSVQASAGSVWPREATGLLEVARAAERSMRFGRACQMYDLLARRHGARDLGYGLVYVATAWAAAAGRVDGATAMVARLRSALDASPSERERAIYGAALVQALVGDGAVTDAPALAGLAEQLRPLALGIAEPAGVHTVVPAYLHLLGVLGTDAAELASMELADRTLERLRRGEEAEFLAGDVLPECARTMLGEGSIWRVPEPGRLTRAEAVLRAAIPHIASSARRASAVATLAKLLGSSAGRPREARALLRGLEPTALAPGDRWRFHDAWAALHEAQLELRQAAAAYDRSACCAPPGRAARQRNRGLAVRLAEAVSTSSRAPASRLPL